MKKFGVILSILTVLTLSFITNNNVSAASDLTYTIDSSNYTSSYTLCSVDCSSYQYLTIEPRNFVSSSQSFYGSMYFSIYWDYPSGGYSNPLGLYGFPNYTVIKLSPARDFDDSYLSKVVFSSFYPSNLVNYLSSGWSVDVTLSENNPAGGITPEGTLDVVANGTYDVTNYASVDVQVDDSSFIVQLFSQGFWGVATAIVTIIVPIIALFLVFRLVHDLLWGRG